MNPSKTCHSTLWKTLAFLGLLMVPLLVWAVQGEQEKAREKERENPPSSKPQGEERKQPQARQQPKTQQAQPQHQQPRTQRQYQQTRQQPQYQQAQPQHQQPRTQRQYQQTRQQPQYQQPKAQPQYQQPKQQPQNQQARPQYQPQRQPSGRMLAPTESQQQIRDLNRNRGTMSGINRNPLPQGQVSVRADGSRTITASGGREFLVRSNGTVARISLSGGRTATFRPNGSLASVHAGGMRITHGLRGERRIVSVRPDHSRVVSVGLHQGYVERPYLVRGGRTYVERTYVVNNVTYVRVYRSYYYRGVPYYYYVPPYYYHPVFYGWVYNPWPVRVYYQWPWFAARPPWYLYWGPYFAPAPYYPSAAFWLTDFLLAESLQAAYEAGREAEANAQAQAYQPPETYQPPPPAPPAQGNTSQITPEMKDAIAAEVSRQLAAEQQSAATASQQPVASSAETTPAALDPAQRLFVVSSNLTLSSLNGQDCELTPGDIITRLDDTPDNNNQVRVSVSSSKGNDCAVGSTLMIQVSDLQEMQNQSREQIDSGLNTLADQSGKGGLPTAPDTGTSAGEVPLPQPDASANSALQAQQQAASQTEAQIQQEAAQGGPNNK